MSDEKHDHSQSIAELRKLSWRNQYILENAIDGFCLFGREGEIIEVNRNFAELLGYSINELQGKHISDLESIDDYERIREKIEKLRAESTDRFETRLRHKDGAEIDLEVSAKYCSFDGEEFFFAFFRDLSESRKAQKALRESEQRFRGLFDHYLNGYALCEIITDDRGDLSDLIILELNKAMEKFKNLDSGDLIGKSIFSVFSVSLDYPAFDMVRELMRTGKPVHREIKSAVFGCWLDVSLYCTGKNQFATIFADISLRKHAEEALRESEERFRGIFNHYLNGYGLAEAVADEQGRIVDFISLEMNNALARILNLPTEKIIGTRINTLFPEARNSPFFEMIAGVLRSGIPVHREFYSNVVGRWLDASLYRTAHNQFGCIIADISERKNAEAELRQSEERYRAIWENSPMGICLTDRDGVYRFVNKAYCEIYGYTEQELIGFSFFEKIMLPGHPRADKSLYSRKFDDPRPSPITETDMFVKKKGDQIWIEYSSDYIYRNGQAELMVTMNLDITKNKKARLELAESEEKYRLLIENAAELILNISSQGVVSLINRSAARQLGGIPEDFIGKSILELFPKETAEQFGREINRVIQTGQAANGELQWVLQDEKRWFSANIQPLLGVGKLILGALVIATDITAQKIIAAGQESRLNFLRRLRNAASVDECLKFGCQAIFEAGLFGRAVLTLHNEKREILHLGQVGMNEQVLSTARQAVAPSPELVRRVTQEKFRIGHSYFIPAESGIFTATENRYIVQEEVFLGKPGAWVNGDELFIPIWGPNNIVEGWLSVDTPFDGKRPKQETIQYIEEIVDICSKQFRQLQSLEKLKEERQALEEKNIALREILAQIKEDKNEIRQKIASNIAQVLLPALNKLVKKDNTVNETYYSILKNGIPELITVSGAFIEAYAKLSPRERQTYNLVKSGATSKEIAVKLHIAVATVQKHREIIRKKLGLTNKNINLSLFLRKL